MLTLETDGAARHNRAALSILPELIAIADTQPAERAGVRLHGVEALRSTLAKDGVLGAIAARELGEECRPVRAILFDKTEATDLPGGLRWLGL